MGANGFLMALVTRLVWVVIAVLIALGGAGIVATMGHAPGTLAREELTWDARAEVAPRLDEATSHLEALAGQVDALAATARQALTQMSSGDRSALEADIAEGTGQLAVVQSLAADLWAAIGAVPYMGDDWALHVSGDLRERWIQLDGTAGLTKDLETNWASFTGRALDASTLSGLLTHHDQQTAAAAKQGAAGKYQAALDLLDGSDATIAAARHLRDGLAKTSDVATLTDWLDRNAAYDAALRTLYSALVKSDGRVSDDVRKAFAGERSARAQLPGDTRAVVVIMSDIAQGGINQAVIAIEEARGSLAQALDVQQQLRDGGALQPPE